MRIKNPGCRCITATLCCLALTACKHTMQASSRSPVQIADSAQPAAQALQNMVASATSLQLCQTEPGTSDCTGPSPTVSTKDLGFIPATLSIESIELSDIQATNQGWSAQAQIKPLINGISPWCRKGLISVELDDNGRSSTSLSSTWCNWLVYGNITIEMSISAEEINLEAGTLAGFYEAHIKGTSNSATSGYLLARIE